MHTLILPNGKSLSALIEQATFVHTQVAANTTWTITHNLGKFPSVTTIESTNMQIHGRLTYVSENVVTVTFNIAVSGKAYLN